MAYTVTILKENVVGNQRKVDYKITTDAVSGAVATKLAYIDSVNICPISMNSAGIKVKANAITATSAGFGSVNIADSTSGDDFFMTVYGR